MWKIAEGRQDGHSNWQAPNSYHVTQLFMGNKAKLASPIYANYQENVSVDVTIPAVVYVPNRILIAVCFPKTAVENEFPHMTLMLGGKWPAVLSNAVLKSTCQDPQKFQASYQEVKAQKQDSASV